VAAPKRLRHRFDALDEEIGLRDERGEVGIWADVERLLEFDLIVAQRRDRVGGLAGAKPKRRLAGRNATAARTETARAGTGSASI
jgi:hypothetical protein